jgi:hypothetical protein
MIEGFGSNQGLSSEEKRNPLIGKAITSGRREAPTREMSIVEMIGLIIGPTTVTRMISEGVVIPLTKHKISEGKMDTPIEEVPEDLSTMTDTSIPEA